jgi:hypothetical protein
MSFAGDETVNGIPVTLSTGERVILYCKTGLVNFHDLKMIEEWKADRNDLTTVIHLKVPRKLVWERKLFITLDLPEERKDHYCFTTSTPGVRGKNQVGCIHHSHEKREMTLDIPLDELTGDRPKILQVRRYHEGNILQVLIDFIITVIPEAPDKVTDRMLTQFAEWLANQNIYGASNALSEVGCYSQKDLEELTLVDIENLDLPELTKRKLLKLNGYPQASCGLVLELERARKRDKSAREGAGSAREGAGSAPEGDG